MADGFKKFNKAKQVDFDLSGLTKKRTIDTSGLFKTSQPSTKTTMPTFTKNVSVSAKALGSSKASKTKFNPYKGMPWYKRIFYKTMASKPVATTLNTLQGVDAIITNQAANWTDKKTDWKDIPLAESIADIAKGVSRPYRKAKNAKDIAATLTSDVLSLGGKPIVRGLTTAGKKAKTTEDVFKNLGWKQAKGEAAKGWEPWIARKGQLDYYDIAAFLGDTAAAPSTHFTFGGASAAKAGIKAARNAAKAAAAEYGVKITKKGAKAFEDIATITGKQVEKKVYDDLLKLGDTPEIAAKKSSIEAENVTRNIRDVSKAAREKAQNAFINLDIPFTKITKQYGTLPKFLQKTDIKVGTVGAHSVRTAFDKMGLGKDGKDISTEFIRSLYGVDKIEDMTGQMLNDFNARMTNYNKKITEHVTQSLQEQGVNEYLVRQIGNILKNKETLNYVDYDNIIKDIQNIRLEPTDADIQNVLNDYVSQLSQNPIFQNIDLGKLVEVSGGNARYLQKAIIEQIKNSGVKVSKNFIEKEIKAPYEALFKGLTENKAKIMDDTITLVRRSLDDRVNELVGAVGGISKDVADLGKQLDTLEKELPDLLKRLEKDKENAKHLLGGDPDIVAKLDELEQINDLKLYAQVAADIAYNGFGLKLKFRGALPTKSDWSLLKGVMDQLRILNHYGLNAHKPDIVLVVKNIKYGKNGTTAAHYVPKDHMIEVFKGGDESFIHEYMHYLDHYISTDGFKIDAPQTGVGSSWVGERLRYGGHPLEGAINTAKREYKKSGKYVPDGPWKTKAEKYAQYYYSDQEIIARLLPEILNNSSLAKLAVANGTDEIVRAIRRSLAHNTDNLSQKTLDIAGRKLKNIFEKYGIKYEDDVIKSKLSKFIAETESKIAANRLKQIDIPVKIQQIKTRQVKLKKDLFDSIPFVQDMGGKSKLTRYLGDKLFAFTNPRTFGVQKDLSADMLNSIAGIIREGDNRMRGNFAYMKSEFGRIGKAIKTGVKNGHFSESDVSKIPYIIENKFPDGQTMQEFLKNVKNPEELVDVASKISTMFDHMGVREVSAGALKMTRQKYFTHAIKDPVESAETLKQLLKNPVAPKLFGRNAFNRFSKERKSFETFADWDDAIKKARRNLELITDPEDYAKADALLQKVENLFERDVFVAMERKYTSHVRSEAMTTMYRDLEKSGGIIKKANIGDKDLQGYLKVDKQTAEQLKYVQEGDYIHKEIAEGLARLDRLFTDKGFQKFIDGMTSAINIFKSFVTTYIPRHYVFNLIGNAANNVMAGVTPNAYRKAIKLMYKQKEGLLDETEKKFMQMAFDDGILSGGSTTDVADPFRLARIRSAKEQGIDDKAIPFLAKMELAVTDNPYTHKISQVGHISDNMARLAHYIEMYKKTGSHVAARDSVRKYLYNYNELTNFDKYIKLPLPFWSFTKNNLPRMLMEFMQQPRYFLTYERLREQMDRGDKKPEYLDGLFGALNIAKNKYYNPRLPMEQLGQVESGPLDFGLNALVPYAKIPFEIKTNTQMYNGAPIDPYYNEITGYDPSAIGKYLINQTGVGSELFKLANAEARKDIPQWQSAAYSVVGRPTTVDPNQVAKSEYYKVKEYYNSLRKKAIAKAKREAKLKGEK